MFLAGIIGFDRERLRKPDGIRTHIMVALGGALLMMISIFTSPVVGGQVQFDPRIVANVVTGLGFLGAGTILHMREGIVTGLTTAATLWIVVSHRHGGRTMRFLYGRGGVDGFCHAGALRHGDGG